MTKLLKVSSKPDVFDQYAAYWSDGSQRAGSTFHYSKTYGATRCGYFDGGPENDPGPWVPARSLPADLRKAIHRAIAEWDASANR